MMGKLHQTTANFLRPGDAEGQIAPMIMQKLNKFKNKVGGKRVAHKDPQEVIPFHEKDEEVLRNF